jgi:hypothetical protein
MKSMAYMTLRLVVATLLLSRSMGDEQRINYGVIFQKHLNIDFATDYCPTILLFCFVRALI